MILYKTIDIKEGKYCYGPWFLLKNGKFTRMDENVGIIRNEYLVPMYMHQFTNHRSICYLKKEDITLQNIMQNLGLISFIEYPNFFSIEDIKTIELGGEIL